MVTNSDKIICTLVYELYSLEEMSEVKVNLNDVVRQYGSVISHEADISNIKSTKIDLS